MEKVGAWSAATASLERHQSPGARGGGRGPTHRGSNPRQTRGTGPGHRAGQRGWGGTDARPSRCPASAMAYCVEPRGVSLRPATPRAGWVLFILPVVLPPLSEQPAPQTRAWRRGSPWMKEGCKEERDCTEINGTVPGPSRSLTRFWMRGHSRSSLFRPSCSPPHPQFNTPSSAGAGGGWQGGGSSHSFICLFSWAVDAFGL